MFHHRVSWILRPHPCTSGRAYLGRPILGARQSVHQKSTTYPRIVSALSLSRFLRWSLSAGSNGLLRARLFGLERGYLWVPSLEHFMARRKRSASLLPPAQTVPLSDGFGKYPGRL